MLPLAFMALVPCPTCRLNNPAQAAICLHCGQPLDEAPPPAAKRGKASGAKIAVAIGVFIVTIGLFAIVTKPGEAELKDAMMKKYASIYVPAVIEQLPGLVDIKFHNHVVFSKATVKIGTEAERTAAIGVFGNIFLADLGSPVLDELRVPAPSPTPAVR